MHNFRAQMKYVKLSATLTPTIEFVAAIGVTMILWFGGNSVIDGDITAGALVAGALEMSNVDLSVEFTDMIITQRGFQANSKIINTSDELLQELVNLKR